MTWQRSCGNAVSKTRRELIYIYNLETIASVDSSVHGRNGTQGAQPKHGAYSESRLVYAVAKKKTNFGNNILNKTFLEDMPQL